MRLPGRWRGGRGLFGVREPSGSFLLKHVSMMRRFSSSNRSALEAPAPGAAPFARSISSATWIEPDQEGEQEAVGGRGGMIGYSSRGWSRRRVRLGESVVVVVAVEGDQ